MLRVVRVGKRFTPTDGRRIPKVPISFLRTESSARMPQGVFYEMWVDDSRAVGEIQALANGLRLGTARLSRDKKGNVIADRSRGGEGVEEFVPHASQYSLMLINPERDLEFAEQIISLQDGHLRIRRFWLKRGVVAKWQIDETPVSRVVGNLLSLNYRL